jgi:phosphoribosylformylglycinamidine (FGAM) synthase-like amidotransferase family enzyme
MHIAILTFSSQLFQPEIAAALERTGMEVIDFLLNDSLEKLKNVQAFILLAESDASEDSALDHFSVSILKEQNAKGKAILGLGYGAAKILAEQGLVPGLYKNMVGLSLSPPRLEAQPLEQRSRICLSSDYQFNAFTGGLQSKVVFPVKGGTTAQFRIPPGLLAEMQNQGQTVFLFCDAEGRALPGNAIAAVSNKAGTVMALLPLPEGATLDLLFQALRAYLESGYREQVDPLYYWPRK